MEKISWKCCRFQQWRQCALKVTCKFINYFQSNYSNSLSRITIEKEQQSGWSTFEKFPSRWSSSYRPDDTWRSRNMNGKSSCLYEQQKMTVKSGSKITRAKKCKWKTAKVSVGIFSLEDVRFVRPWNLKMCKWWISRLHPRLAYSFVRGKGVENNN